MHKPGEDPIMTPSQLEVLESNLRERAKPLGDRHWIDATQRLASDLADVVAHLRAMEQEAEQGFRDAQQATNAGPKDVPTVTIHSVRIGLHRVFVGPHYLWGLETIADADALKSSIEDILRRLWSRTSAEEGGK